MGTSVVVALSSRASAAARADDRLDLLVPGDDSVGMFYYYIESYGSAGVGLFEPFDGDNNPLLKVKVRLNLNKLYGWFGIVAWLYNLQM